MNKNKQFTLISFVVLMQNIMQKSPDYMLEKFNIIGDDVEYAFAKLDFPNQTLVINYCKEWGFEIPTVVKNYMDYMNKEYSSELI